jgi:hypothetical protein
MGIPNSQSFAYEPFVIRFLLVCKCKITYYPLLSIFLF